jgi:hypothetical protein
MRTAIEGKQFKVRDRVGGTVITDLYKFEDGSFTAYSFYWQDEDEECVAEASGDDPEKTVKQSRKNLRKEWVQWLDWKKENPDHKPSFTIFMADGRVIESK